MKNVLSGLVWVLAYLGFCLAPLLLTVGQADPAGRPFLVEFSIALGFVGLAILALQFALIARFKVVAAPFGIDALLKFHVQITFVGVAFVLAHPILLFFADSKYLALLNLVTAPWRARFAFASVVALLALVALSVWRARLKLRYEVWQATHGIAAVLVLLFALVHVGLVGFYVTGPVRHLVFYGYFGLLVLLLVWVRLISPLRRRQRPWRVVTVTRERGDSSTLVIEPVGHTGFSFDPGQFDDPPPLHDLRFRPDDGRHGIRSRRAPRPVHVRSAPNASTWSREASVRQAWTTRLVLIVGGILLVASVAFALAVS